MIQNSELESFRKFLNLLDNFQFFGKRSAMSSSQLLLYNAILLKTSVNNTLGFTSRDLMHPYREYMSAAFSATSWLPQNRQLERMIAYCSCLVVNFVFGVALLFANLKLSEPGTKETGITYRWRISASILFACDAYWLWAVSAVWAVWASDWNKKNPVTRVRSPLGHPTFMLFAKCSNLQNTPLYNFINMRLGFV